MASKKPFPYIPNSNEAVRREMLDYIGVEAVEDIYRFIPEDILLNRPLNLPEPIHSEMELKAHMDGLMSLNRTCRENLNFLGAGCYDHYVPAICDEVNSRAEFVTTYSNDTYRDHGKNQIFFEYASLMGELLNLDVVCFPVYDGGQAACTSILMTTRITKRRTVLIPGNLSPTLLEQIRTYCTGITFTEIESEPNGQMHLGDLESKMNDQVACVFLQNPAFLGFFEERAEEIGQIAHAAGAKLVVYATPSSLGVVAPPADYGADISCGDIQPLGIHMSYGSGLGGYIATRQETEYIMNYPGHLHGIFTNEKGEFGFTRTLQERTTYHARENAVEFIGTYVGLWTVTATVYLSLMGPEGMRELGENILCLCSYAQKQLASLPGVHLPFKDSKSFQEFVVNFDGAGKTVEAINQALLCKNIFGGYDLSKSMPALGQSMLLCVTEKTSAKGIDAMTAALREILTA